MRRFRQLHLRHQVQIKDTRLVRALSYTAFFNRLFIDR